MTPLEEAWLALNLVEGVGQKTIRRLLYRFGKIEALMDAPAREISRAAGIKPDLAARIAKAREGTAFQIEKRLVADEHVRLCLLDSDGYPPLLRETDIPPPLLYVKGELPPHDHIHLAVVGTRNFTHYGEKATRRIIEELAALEPDLVIVSGLARGIDTVAHQQALACGLKTIAVMAGGLTRIYPPENAELADRIMGQGALISEAPMTAPPLAKSFPIRNRIISGLSWGILVAEAGEKSGALITSGFGINHNREIFAIPGNIDAKSFRGVNRLIQRGQAKLVREAADILEERTGYHLVGPEQLRLLAREDGAGAAKGAPPGTDKYTVLEVLRRGALHPDDLSQETALPMERLLGILLELELAGEIYQTAENQYATS